MAATSPVVYERFLDGKSVVIVGPAGYLEGSGQGEWIDGHDVVVRVNWGCPVPEELKQDYGTRTDILYKRLLKLGKIDKMDLNEYKSENLQWIVALESAFSRNQREFEKAIGEPPAIPYLYDNNLRAKLRSQMSSSPLAGMMAIAHLLQYKLSTLDIVGFDFYQSGYHAGYGGRAYREYMHRKEGTIGRMHDGKAQLKWLAELAKKDNRIRFDTTLTMLALGASKKGAARDTLIVIPARMKSSRFPGKPLALINGVPMIVRVAEQAAKTGFKVVVATESTDVASVVRAAGYLAELTSEDCLTGTDRVYEVAIGHPTYRYFVNVQGDEPLVDPMSILLVADTKRRLKDKAVVGAYSLIEHDDAAAEQRHVVKLAMSGDRLIYASRAAIPSTKEGGAADRAQVGLYAYTIDDLKAFVRKGKRSPLEATEDVEILRFVEQGKDVRMVQVPAAGCAVDLPEHIGIVEEILNGIEEEGQEANEVPAGRSVVSVA